MKCLVTGGAGFIGSNLALKLEFLGHDVVVLDTSIRKKTKNLEKFRGRLIEGDESVISSLKERYDVVFHQSANTNPRFPDDSEMLRNNIEGFKRVLDYQERTKAKVVYASSSAVYGRGNIPMNENQPGDILSAYAKSKLEMEKLAVNRYNGGTLVGLRYFNVYGPHETLKGKTANVIFHIASQIKDCKNPKIFEFGDQKRDNIYVEDILDLNLLAMSYDGCEIFNAGTGTARSFNEIIKILNKELRTNLAPEYIKNPYGINYQDVTLADMSKTKKILGFSHQYSLERGIKEYVKYLDTNGWT